MLPKKENKKKSIPVFRQWVYFQVGFGLKIANFEVLINQKILYLQVLFSWLQESSQSNIRVKRYDENTKTSQNFSMTGFFQQ